ncbi:MAG: SDR family NAD(P)-dependent oxidoreductase [Anaerolineales bacterium]|nr:SDR family NAD(P)-dependent oxidoreductase [Chloroflexota bacterium]MBL6979919.1 SDR family NAD(P)-dependent oxidoreductase [Anaerolineales bacterium]
MSNFKDKVAVVTGATGNLGAATARAFYQADANLVLFVRKPDSLAKMIPEIAETNERFLVIAVDMTNPESVHNAVERAIDNFGRIDMLVNTFGGYRAGTPVHETPLETWDFMHALNARTAFIASQAVIPNMLENGNGKIINIGARPGLKGRKNMAAYGASKSGVIRLTESMAAELKDQDINVNCILPGTIDTPQNRHEMPKADHSKWVTPEAIAQVILFLVSDAANPIHGAAIPVYGKS